MIFEVPSKPCCVSMIPSVDEPFIYPVTTLS